MRYFKNDREFDMIALGLKMMCVLCNYRECNGPRITKNVTVLESWQMQLFYNHEDHNNL